jgi:DNA modification methylase
MKSEQINSQINNGFSNSLLHGDCIELLSRMASSRVDFVLTDPPYLAHSSSRDGRSVPNDNNCDWVRPAFQEIYRVLCWNASASASTAGTKLTSSSLLGVKWVSE